MVSVHTIPEYDRGPTWGLCLRSRENTIDWCVLFCVGNIPEKKLHKIVADDLWHWRISFVQKRYFELVGNWGWAGIIREWAGSGWVPFFFTDVDSTFSMLD